MATLKPLYSGETTITCGIDGLANNSSRQSTAVDNTTNLYLDALVSVKCQTATGSLGTNPVLYIYAYGWSQGQASDYTDNATGSDGAFTLASTPNVRLIGVVNYDVTANTTLFAGPFSVAMAFGGLLPGKWGVIVNNQTGLALSGTAGQQVNNVASYVGLQVQSV